jgi:hypothetical protein
MPTYRILFADLVLPDMIREADTFTIDEKTEVLSLMQGATVAMFPAPHWRGIVEDVKE